MRYSILSLLIAITLAALVVSHYRTSYELSQVKSELHTAKRELAYLEIEELDRVYAVALPSFEPMQWRWRIQLPTSSKFQLMSCFGEIPLDGFPKPGWTEAHILRDDSGKQRVGEFILTFAVHKNENETWTQTTKVLGDSYSTPIKDPPSWLNDRSFVNWQMDVNGTGKTVSCPSLENLTLLRFRKAKSSTGRTSIVKEPMPGMMFWIAPIMAGRQ